MRTYSLKAADIEKKWLIIDARDLVLGRLAAHIANLLRGKHKPCYSPHLDCGDNVIITNAEHVYLTGKKLSQKTFYWHTGYPGGVKSKTAKEILVSSRPEQLLRNTVKRMLPKGVLGRQQLANLRVYSTEEHPHTGQQPEKVVFAVYNVKNTRR